MESLTRPQTRLSAALSQPTKLMGKYEEFVTKNSSSVSQVESALRSLTYIIPGSWHPSMILPGRFRESELASESIHSGVQLLSLYHDSLVARVISRLPLTVPRSPPTPHARYTKYWTSSSALYRRVALVLQMIKYTELLWEMIARRRGEKIRWRVVVLIEGLKAFCRLILLRLTNSRALVSPPLPEREVDPRPAEDEDEGGDWNGMDTPKSSHSR
ncbi:YlPEX16 [Coccidioides immitis H538.4]|uniref:Peroxisomal membrane protein PEX16 n=1 Tax=Coccidioides immitis H538.4 TaxID=396776 RepID=A0A0J8RNH5_COCIT|nr:YlPEX16 [Coccidioides immitis H538.4]